MYWIGHTTKYRAGSAKFARAAETLRADLAARYPRARVVVEALESKHDFVSGMRRLAEAGARIDQLHFIGHSGMYGIMFGSTAWPEQLSPHEWRSVSIPFATGASAYFHACRTARWFAPFFARTFQVRTFGNHGYTTVSSRPDRFTPEAFQLGRGGPLYLVAVPGRKTHGWWGSARKYALRPPVEPMLAFEPTPAPDAGYDSVAELYDRAFSDIRVRHDEWRWLNQRLDRAFPRGSRAPRVLDLGCGNGALLIALRDRIASGVGVDVSPQMVERAERRARPYPRLSFSTIHGPELPYPDASFDVVTSFLSFRYLDWDPVLREVTRVLKPGGHLLIVDMVEQKPGLREASLLVRSVVRHALSRIVDRRFARDLRTLVSQPAWAVMLAQNPIRALHEYRWYLESRFPGQKLVTLNASRHARLVAFDSGGLEPQTLAPLSFP